MIMMSAIVIVNLYLHHFNLGILWIDTHMSYDAEERERKKRKNEVKVLIPSTFNYIPLISISYVIDKHHDKSMPSIVLICGRTAVHHITSHHITA